MVGFALGTETGGSIIGPAATNGVSGFRPTFGLSSRAYCMALSQTFVSPLAYEIVLSSPTFVWLSPHILVGCYAE